MRIIALAAAAVLASGAAATPATAQFYPGPVPLCPTPWGMAPCGPPMPPMPRPMPFPPPGPFPGPMPAPGPSYTFNMPAPGPSVPPQWNDLARQVGVPPDGLLIAEIGQTCGPNPKCWAVSWGAIEMSRCAGGFGVRGGCFGPNGEIRRLIDGTVRDITQGPGKNHDIVGCNGWLSRTFGGRC